MSTTYTATANLVADAGQAADALTHARGTTDAVCIVARASVHPVGADTQALMVTFRAGNDAEARTVFTAALRATGRPYDTVRITAGRGAHRRQVAGR